MDDAWEALAQGVYRRRMQFLDVTIGVVFGRDGVVLIDCGSTLAEGRAVDADVRAVDPRGVTDLVLTHDHFDHVLGSPVFGAATLHCAPQVIESLTNGTEHLRADALHYGAAASEIDEAVAALRPPASGSYASQIDLGDRIVRIEQPGRGHTGHDLIAVVGPGPGAPPDVVFCGDLVEESGTPAVGPDSYPAEWPVTLDRLLAAGGDTVYVPGHGAVVDAEFIRGQREWLRRL